MFEVNKLPAGGNDDAMMESFRQTVAEMRDVYVTDCMRASGQMLAAALTKQAIDKVKLTALKGQP